MDGLGSGSANIAKAKSLDIGTWRYNSQETIKIAGLNAEFNTATPFPDFGLSAAVSNGFDPSYHPLQQTVEYNCTTGNCTWPIYTSLALCSACNDISRYINKSAGYGDGDEALLTDGNSPTFVANYTSYEIPFASNLHIMNVDGYCGVPCIDNELMTAKPTADASQTITFQNLTTMLLAVGMMQPNQSYGQNGSAWEDTSVQATECALYFCAQAYSSQVQKNVLNESSAGSWTDRTPNSWQPAPAAQQAMGPGTNMTAIDEVFQSFNGSLYWGDYETLAITMTDLQIAIPDDAVANGTSLPPNITRAFNISQPAIASTIYVLLNMWPSDNNTEAAGAGQFNIYFSPDQQYIFTAPIMQALYTRNAQPSDQFANVANSVSNYIRGLDYAPPMTQDGIAQEWVPHIRVRWGFVALPVLVFVVGCVFTVLSIVETRKTRMPAWKENAMPVLTHGLDGRTRALMRGAGTKEEHRAKRTMVRLVDEGDGLELKS